MSTSQSAFVKKTFDEFTDKATVEHVSVIKWGQGFPSGGPMGEMIGLKASGVFANNFTFKLRFVKTKDLEVIVLDCELSISHDWFRADDGVIIFNCDQQNTELKFVKHNTQVIHLFSVLYCNETGSYPLPLALLKKICDTNVLKIRITGHAHFSEPDSAWCEAFKKYCQQFYNGAFDSSAYAAALVGGPPKKSGCFVATAAMGSHDHPSVLVLRNYRDQILAESSFGRKFIETYYSLSPRLAAMIERNGVLKRFVRVFLIKPASSLAAWQLQSAKGKIKNSKRSI